MNHFLSQPRLRHHFIYAANMASRRLHLQYGDRFYSGHRHADQFDCGRCQRWWWQQALAPCIDIDVPGWSPSRLHCATTLNPDACCGWSCSFQTARRDFVCFASDFSWRNVRFSIARFALIYCRIQVLEPSVPRGWSSSVTRSRKISSWQRESAVCVLICLLKHCYPSIRKKLINILSSFL